MVGGKKGWIRILEATIASLIVLSVLLVIYSNNQSLNYDSDLKDTVSLTQKEILRDISLRDDLRESVLAENYVVLDYFVNDTLPAFLNYSLVICDFAIDSVSGEILPCTLSNEIYTDTIEKNVYVEERIISSTLEEYQNPKRVKLYVWEK